MKISDIKKKNLSKFSMTPEQLKQHVKKLGPWEPWIERPFGAFVLSFSKTFTHPHAFKKFGIDAGYNAILYERKNWHRSPHWDNKLQRQLLRFLKSGKTIFDLSKQCEQFHASAKKEIATINANKQLNPITKLKILSKIFYTAMDFVWVTHSFETVYVKTFRNETKRFIKTDINEFIRSISFPIKKNAHALMIEELAAGHDLKTIARKYSWIKARFKFIPGYSITELKKMRREITNEQNDLPQITKVKIPIGLKKSVNEMRELVYFRTYRTDVLYELLYLARPSLKEIAKYFHLNFQDLENYTVDSLIAKRPKYYPFEASSVFYGGEYAFLNKPLLKLNNSSSKITQGNIAFTGVVKGQVKIVRSVHDLHKVKTGNILITPTTVPSYLSAMFRAAAFVTDEGGLTCHAAIVARELKKPCIIGTKIATKVFKDGDLVEVDANKGIVKKIS